jgi:hypothetical protein
VNGGSISPTTIPDIGLLTFFAVYQHCSDEANVSIGADISFKAITLILRPWEIFGYFKHEIG